MPAINPRADRVDVREIPSDVELDIQRIGGAVHTSPEDREAMARAAELLGMDRTARILRDAIARRARVAAVPDDARPPLQSRAAVGQGPILGVVDGGRQEASADEAWWSDVERLVTRHEGAGVTQPARLLREALALAARTAPRV